MSGVHAGHVRRENGKVHNLQRLQRGVRDMSDHEPKPQNHRCLQQAIQDDVLHHHVQAVHSPTRWLGVLAREGLLLYM